MALHHTSRTFNRKGEEESLSRRPLFIAVISIAIVAVLLVLYFIGSQFVGKAIELPAEKFQESEGGMVNPVRVPVGAGQEFVVELGARLPIGTQSVAYEYVVQYDVAQLEFIRVETVDAPTTDWGTTFLRVSEPQLDQSLPYREIKVEHATIDYEKPLLGGKAYELSRVRFRVKPGQTLEAADFVSGAEVIRLPHEAFKVWNLENTMTPRNVITLPVKQPSAERIAVASVCGNSVHESGEQCDDGNTINGDGCSAVCTLEITPPQIDFTACGAICTANQHTVCAGFCPAPTPGYRADLTLDNKFDGQDAQVIFGSRDARADANCGGAVQAPCVFDKLNVCDDGTFRVTGISIYNGGVPFQTGTGQCPFTMVTG